MSIFIETDEEWEACNLSQENDPYFSEEFKFIETLALSDVNNLHFPYFLNGNQKA